MLQVVSVQVSVGTGYHLNFLPMQYGISDKLRQAVSMQVSVGIEYYLTLYSTKNLYKNFLKAQEASPNSLRISAQWSCGCTIATRILSVVPYNTLTVDRR